jgi:short-subunit dehydrogenase
MKIVFISGYTGDIGGKLLSQLQEKGYLVFGINAREGEEKITQHIKEVLEKWTSKIEKVFLVNAIGCFVFGPSLKLSEEDFLKSFRCNFLVPIKVIQIFAKVSLEILGKDRKKYIVNINSQAALKPFWYGGAYNSMKSALNMFLKIFEKENRNLGFKVKQFFPPVIDNTKIIKRMPYKPKNDKIISLDDFIREVGEWIENA